MEEIWMDIKGYEGIYKISNHGRVLSAERLGTKGGQVKPRIPEHGYPYYVLSKNNVTATKKSHRLVAEHFVDNPHNKPHVNHIDGDKLNSRADNLEWCTAKENILHAHKMNLSKHAKGAESLLSKVSHFDRLHIVKMYAFDNLQQSEIARKFNISKRLVSYIVRSFLRDAVLHGNLLPSNLAIDKNK